VIRIGLAPARVTGSEGNSGRIKFKIRIGYHPFRIKDLLPVVISTSSSADARWRCGSRRCGELGDQRGAFDRLTTQSRGGSV